MGEIEEEARATITGLLDDVDFGVKAEACAALASALAKHRLTRHKLINE